MAAQEHAGHRKRLDEKTVRWGFENLEEHEQLEKLLFAVIPRGNTNVIAHQLLDEFGTLYRVLTADTEALSKVEGVGNRTAQFLHDLFPLLASVERSMYKESALDYPDVSTAEAMGIYAKTLFYGKLRENVYLVSVNKRLQAFRADKISEGSMEETPVYLQEAVKLALSNGARSVFLAHNHPSGALHPSYEDIRVTGDLYQAFKTVGISLLDHIIVGGGEYLSLRNHGVF